MSFEGCNTFLFTENTIKHTSPILLFFAFHYERGGSRGGTIPRAPNHWGAPKNPIMSQILSWKQHICFRKTSVSNMGTPNVFLAPGAI